MIAVDSSVLLRYLLMDDVEQSAAAASVIDRALAESDPVFVSIPVLCESVWVLTRGYRMRREQIRMAVGALLEQPGFRIEHASEARAALSRYQTSEPGFVDLLISEIAAAEGCSATYTFDRALLRSAGFQRP